MYLGENMPRTQPLFMIKVDDKGVRSVVVYDEKFIGKVEEFLRKFAPPTREASSLYAELKAELEKVRKEIEESKTGREATAPDLAGKVKELEERLRTVESVLSGISDLEERVGRLEEGLDMVKGVLKRHADLLKTVKRKGKGLDRLKKLGFLFEDDLKDVRDLNRLLAWFERQGARVFTYEAGVMIADPDALKSMLNKFIEKRIPESEVVEMLSDRERRAFEFLRETGHIELDSEKRWAWLEAQ